MRARFALGCLALVYLSAVFAGFVAPYDPTTQHRDLAFAPPTRLHFVDDAGRLHLRPFVYAITPSSTSSTGLTEDRSRPYPVRLFDRGARYRLAGLVDSDWHLFGTESPTPLFLF